jgi:hypothetical protein
MNFAQSLNAECNFKLASLADINIQVSRQLRRIRLRRKSRRLYCNLFCGSNRTKFLTLTMPAAASRHGMLLRVSWVLVHLAMGYGAILALISVPYIQTL